MDILNFGIVIKFDLRKNLRVHRCASYATKQETFKTCKGEPRHAFNHNSLLTHFLSWHWLGLHRKRSDGDSS